MSLPPTAAPPKTQQMAAALREEARMEAMAYGRRSLELTAALVATLKVVVQQAQLVAGHRENVERLLAQAESLIAQTTTA